MTPAEGSSAAPGLRSPSWTRALRFESRLEPIGATSPPAQHMEELIG